MTPARANTSVPIWVRDKAMEVFGADLRSLAAFRIVLALLVLADLGSRATDLSAHYSDKGVLPRTALVEQLLSRWSFSLNLMNGEPFFQALLFIAAALAALGLLFGYHTRLMTVLVWVLLLSIQWRNPLVGGADGPLLRLLLFWGMFLPLGAWWSLDRALRGASYRPSMQFLSVATLGLFMQIAFVYLFTALLKSGPEWREDDTAIYYVLSLDQISTSMGDFLLRFPNMLEVMTIATFALEAFGPFLLFSPLFTGPVRTAAAFSFMSLHFGIWLTMDIGIFPWISAFCMVCFLPSWFWENAAKLHAEFPKRFDVAHRLPNLTKRLDQISQALSKGLFTFVPHVSQPSIAGPMPRADGAQSGSFLSRVFSWPSTPAFAGVREGGVKATRGPHDGGGAAGSEPTRLRSSLLTNLLAAFFLLYVFCWNLTTVSAFTMPERAYPIGPFLGLDQHWGMFAPSPTKQDGWYVIPGTLRNGRQTDLMSITHGDFDLHEVSWEKPQDVNDIYKNERWRKYMENLWEKQHADQRLYFGKYICREWNARHTGAEQLIDFQIIYMLEETLPNLQESKPQRAVTWNHTC